MTTGIFAFRKRYIAFIVLVWLGFSTLGPRIVQDPSYHKFAGSDQSWNIYSNLGFLAVGIWALGRRAHWSLAVGLILTALGSAYYHAEPGDDRLVWDRLPMTIVFSGFTALVIERWAGLRLFWPLMASGIGSALWWRETGDLRWYAAVQFGPVLVAIPAAISDPAVRGLWSAGLLYLMAKLAESFDVRIYELLGLSGHTFKHLFAAGAAFLLVRWSLNTGSEQLADEGGSSHGDHTPEGDTGRADPRAGASEVGR